MGDTYYMDLKCAHCGHLNEDCGWHSDFENYFKCEKCKERNDVVMDLKAVKKEVKK